MFRRGLILILVIVTLNGCTSMKRNYAPEVKNISYPEINSVKTINVGDKIVAKGRYFITDVLDIKKESGGVYYNIPAGIYRKVGVDESKNYYNFSGKGVAVQPSSWGDPVSGIYTKRNGEKEVCVITAFHQSECYDAEYVEHKADLFNNDSFLLSLIYGGKHGNTLQVTFTEQFREIGGTRHNIEYDVLDGSVIKYRGAEILIIQSTPNTLTYKVLSSFKVQQN